MLTFLLGNDVTNEDEEFPHISLHCGVSQPDSNNIRTAEACDYPEHRFQHPPAAQEFQGNSKLNYLHYLFTLDISEVCLLTHK